MALYKFSERLTVFRYYDDSYACFLKYHIANPTNRCNISTANGAMARAVPVCEWTLRRCPRW